MISQRLDLKPHVDALRQYVPAPRGVKKIHHALGANNMVMFGYLPVRREQQDQKQIKTSKFTSVVYTVPKFYSNDVRRSSLQAMQYLRHAMPLLESKSAVPGVHSPFVQTVLYQGQHGKVSEKMLGDLHKVITDSKNSQKPGLLDFKNIFAQILLGVYALHSRGLVHRDIKPENILIKHEGDLGYRVELADLDTVAFFSDKSLNVFGTSGYVAPEISSTLTESGTYFENGDYVAADKRALDCYALGITFFNILRWDREFTSDDESTDILELRKRLDLRKSLLKLASRFIELDPKQRLTVEQALQNHCFGKTPEERAAYFQEMIDKFKKRDMFYDSYYKASKDSYPEEDDAFLLLSASLKEIYHVAADLDDVIKIANDCREIFLTDAIESKAHQLIFLIDKEMQSEFKKPKEILLPLRVGAEESLKLCRLRKMTSKDILHTVRRILGNYDKINGISSEQYSIFSLHGMPGLLRARSLVENLEALSVLPFPVEAMTAKIQDFLLHGEGPWRFTSFKTLLKNELIKLTGVTPEVWGHYLPNVISVDQKPKK